MIHSVYFDVQQVIWIQATALLESFESIFYKLIINWVLESPCPPEWAHMFVMFLPKNELIQGPAQALARHQPWSQTPE